MATKKKAAGLTVKLVKSAIGSKKDQIATVEALGLAVAENNTYDAAQTTTEGNRPHNRR